MKAYFVFLIMFICLFKSHLKAQIQPLRVEKKFRKFISNSNISPNFEQNNLILVNFNRILTAAEVNQIKPRKRLSSTYFIVEKQNVAPFLNEVGFQGEVNGLWKASEQLSKILDQQAKRSDAILVRLAMKKMDATLPDYLKPFKIQETDIENKIFKILISANDLAGILGHDDIIYADVVPIAKEEIVINGLDLGLNQISNAHALYPTIDGKGINISFKEGMYDGNDLDLMGKTVTGSLIGSPIITSHATIMATLALGNGNSFIRGLGAAPASKLAFSSFSNLMPDPTANFNRLNISIQNHSYGTDLDNVYGIEAAAYDKQIYDTDTLIHTFSAGNKGTSTPTSGLYKDLVGRANLTGNFKQAKNVLVIGGINRDDQSESLSSKGPAYDGRVKPELVALGEDGTSGSAAITSGSIALLEQFYRNKFQKAPSAAIIKAILINSADDLGTPHVDYTFGYGKLNAYQALKTIDENRFSLLEVAKGQDLIVPINVPPNTREVKVTIAWNDLPAVVNATQSIVNHLNLSFENQNGSFTLPWTLSSFPNLDSLLKPASRRVDVLNNVQQVSLENLSEGVYNIHINGKDINQGNSQKFALSYSFLQKDAFSFISPENNTQFFAEEENFIRWKNTFSTQNGRILVSYNGGASWSQLVDHVDLSKGFYKWYTENKFSKAILKMEISGNSYLSNSFVVSSPRVLRVGYLCKDALALNWNPQPDVKDYTLYALIDNKLKPLQNITDTLVKLDLKAINSKYFAVAANGTDFTGLKSYTIDCTQQGISCYVQALFANVADAGIKLDLNIGTTLDLKSITWEKQTGVNTFSILKQTIVADNLLNYSILDDQPKPGIQFYRVVFETNAGVKIQSDLVSAVFLKDDQFAFYPNPASDYINILSGSFEDYNLMFYNMLGQKVYDEKATSSNRFSIDKLSSGVYIGVIQKSGQQLKKFKLIKN